MLSGNGRHRRPRQAPALIVAAGVTGSAIAIPLLAATGASAADGTTWDKVAECESGGSWSADTGNGYFGGLQISQDDWEAHGGQEYASSPDQASRSQQIAVAEKILADEGTTPWATCALLSGLSAHSGSVSVDTGVSGLPSSSSSSSSSSSGSSHSSGEDGSSGTAESDKSGKSSGSSGDSDSGAKGSTDSSSSSALSSGDGSGASPSASPSSGADAKDGSGGSPKSGASASSDSEGGRDDVSPVETAGADGSDNSWQNGGSWSLVDTGSVGGGGRHRGDSADESRTSGASTSSLKSTGRHAYTVREGDSLASIADSLGVDGGWRALYADNKDAIGADPNNIAPGQTLRVGAENGAD